MSTINDTPVVDATRVRRYRLTMEMAHALHDFLVEVIKSRAEYLTPVEAEDVRVDVISELMHHVDAVYDLALRSALPEHPMALVVDRFAEMVEDY